MQTTIQRAHPAWPAITKLRMTLDCSGIAKNLACSRRLDLGDSAKDVSRNKKITRGWGRGESEGTPV